MGNAQILSAEVVDCPHCNSSLKLNDSERRFGQMIICPNCDVQFENKPISRAKRVLLPLFLIIAVILFCSAVSSLINTDKTNSNTQRNEQAIAGIKTATTIEATPTISITITTTPKDTISPTATAKPTPVATILHTPIATTKPTPKPTARPTAKPTPKPTSKPAPYTCNCSKTCTQITTCKEAQFQLNSCGCKQRDADHDGIACDGAPLNCQ